ncbi:COP1-interactive protein 1 [Abeliophyllum distichum]|uniref:COP1-interactive protein 1 n=1 Tax=Abeliophyllum distichum TaxID=126358 RepID=A0ABD1UIU1_9LAMI
MVSKHRWKGSMKSFRSTHLDPQKEEHLKGVKIEIENKARRILKLIKSINQGNKENKMKKNKDDDSSSTSTSDSESRDSPNDSTREDVEIRNDIASEDLEDVVLKDKFTSTIETIDLDSQSSFEMSREESRENLKDLEVQDELSESARLRAMDEGKRLVQRKDDLEGQVSSLSLEIEALLVEKRETEERIDCTLNEAKELKSKNSELEAQILDLQEKSKQKDDHFSVLTKTFEEHEQHYKSRIEGLMKQANSFELEMNSLHTQKGELERRCEEGSSRVEDLKKRANFLHQELETMSNQKGELKLELENKSKEASNYLNQIENLNEKFTEVQGTMEEKEGLKLLVQDLELEVKSINTKKSDLEEKMVRIYEEVYQSRVENEELQKKIPELQTDISKKENELNKLKNDLDALQSEKNRLKLELETEKQNSVISISNMEKKNIELTKKLAEIRGEHKQQSKSNIQMAERKIEEMAKEFRKQFEDNLRIMSRRIRVAEQLQAENKDCYSKMKEIYERENKELKERFGKAEVGLKNVKELSLTVNDMLNSLDTVGLKFEECTANFLNRISKVSCELKFAKDWVRRKNKAAVHLKDDLNCLLSQMDEKEAEILVFRERVWKSENKVRELEKMNKHNEDGMLVIQEEKREAIRQLCVWIDYHRSRSDYYKKMLTEITPGYRRTS